MNKRKAWRFDETQVSKPRSYSVMLLSIILLVAVLASGCQRIQAVMEEKKHKAQNREIMAKRYVEIGEYVQKYFEDKYNEDFVNEGLYHAWVGTGESVDYSSAEFAFKSNYTGVRFQPVYYGSYANPEFNTPIEAGRIHEYEYWVWRKGYEFNLHEKNNVEAFFPGVKKTCRVGFSFPSELEDEIFKNSKVVDPKYFDVDYLLINETDKLDCYYLTLEYFKDVTPQNKEAMLTEFYQYLMYTRSLGFKHCSITAVIYDESVQESDVYKEYLSKGGQSDLSLYLGAKDIRYIQVDTDKNELDTVETLEDLSNLKIFDEFTAKGLNRW